MFQSHQLKVKEMRLKRQQFILFPSGKKLMLTSVILAELLVAGSTKGQSERMIESCQKHC